MKLSASHHIPKRYLYILILILSLIIISDIFPFLPKQVVFVFYIFLLILAVILLFLLGKKVPAPAREEVPAADETYFITIADQIPFMVWRSDPDGKCIYVNKKWVSFTGISYEDSLGYGFSKAMALPENQERRQEWMEIVKNHQPYELKFPLKDAAGNLRFVLAQANAYHIDEVFQGYIGSIIDITEQENSIIEVQALSDRKDEFLSIASHELKTPLTSIKALFQLIERNIGAEHKAFGFLNRANHNILRLERLISNLLDVSKLNAGKLTYDISEFDFQEMLAEAVEGMQNVAPNHRIILHKGEEVSFNGDKFRMEQVIYNFLSNAVKYSPGGEDIMVKAETVNNNIVVSVQDFGIGIKKEDIEQIFNRYYRVDNTVMKFEGLGLGLFISSEIIKRHQGSFWIESEFGKGSTFYFILPLNDQSKQIGLETDGVTFYRDETISIKIDAVKRCLTTNWIGYQNLKTVKAGCLIMLDLVKKNNCVKVLNDNTFVMGNWSEAADWVAEEWFPLMAVAGIKQFAWIYSPSIFSQLAAEKSKDVILSGIMIQFFNNEKEATTWLQY